MIAAYGKEAVMCFCKCNAFKYLFRFEKKNGIEDIKKAQWYQDKYIELKNGEADDSFIKKLGFDPNYCSWHFGNKAEVINHEEILE